MKKKQKHTWPGTKMDLQTCHCITGSTGTCFVYLLRGSIEDPQSHMQQPLTMQMEAVPPAQALVSCEELAACP